MKIEHIVEQDLNEWDMDVEDGGKYMGFHICKDDMDYGIYLRFCSWDDKKHHDDFSDFIGKRVRITVETI